MQLALNLISRILPFPKGKIFFTLRFILFQTAWSYVLGLIFLFLGLHRCMSIKVQIIALLSLYIFWNTPANALGSFQQGQNMNRTTWNFTPKSIIQPFTFVFFFFI